MDKNTAVNVLKNSFTTVNDQEVKCINPYVEVEKGNLVVILDGEFSAEELQSIAVWMEAE